MQLPDLTTDEFDRKQLEPLLPGPDREQLSYHPLQTQKDDDQNFKPTGAIVFFILLIAMGALIWFSIYDLQLSRH
jgi:hypothetical protein